MAAFLYLAGDSFPYLIPTRVIRIVMFYRLFCLSLFAGLLSSPVLSQNRDLSTTPYSMPNTELRYLHSSVNGIDYKLYISYPEDYFRQPTKAYPVLYLLDADYSFAIAKNITDHLSHRNHLQEILLVGIAYDGPNRYRINRTRDYTPTHSIEPVGFPEIQEAYSGGGKKFLDFLEQELLPYIDREFRTTHFRAITGHSYGGLFASWTLLTRPRLFDGYILVSPSLWYDRKLLFRIDDHLAEHSGDLRIYCTVGDREVNEHWNMPQDLSEFVKRLKDKNLPQLHLEFEVGEGETHNSIFPSAVSNGIRFVFDGI